jgi:predicted nucleic acid-binding protein
VGNRIARREGRSSRIPEVDGDDRGRRRSLGAGDQEGTRGFLAFEAVRVICLDTGFLIRALVPSSPEDRMLRRWLQRGEALGISSIAWAEFLCGPVAEADARLASEILTEKIAFGLEAAATAADLYKSAGRRRGSLVDCMIAAAAVRAGVPLATANPQDFRKLAQAGLKLLGA